jgi:deazaflavin-dependent oxidoreductase (nitroreductase family)
MTNEVHDSPTPWVKEHIDRYVESGGQEGHDWRGVPTLLLTTKGRKSGELRRSALIYGRLGAEYLIVASVGGADHHPAWYLNLTADPQVEVQVGADVFKATARTAGEDEKAGVWSLMTAIWPDYNDYQSKTDRPIPVVILTPTD